jgi:hypothetical protein
MEGELTSFLHLADLDLQELGNTEKWMAPREM